MDLSASNVNTSMPQSFARIVLTSSALNASSSCTGRGSGGSTFISRLTTLAKFSVVAFLFLLRRLRCSQIALGQQSRAAHGYLSVMITSICTGITSSPESRRNTARMTTLHRLCLKRNRREIVAEEEETRYRERVEWE